MNISVGLLYSSQEFLDLAKTNKFIASEFQDNLRRFSLSEPSKIIEICQKCDWILIDQSGYCEVTDKGLTVINERTKKDSLRIQLKHIIEYYQPSWVNKMKSGRAEVAGFLPDSEKQIFKEAGLLDDWDSSLIEWWDELVMVAYSASSYQNLKIGRMAETNTVIYEEHRTKNKPEWISLDSNHAGYDILSCVRDTDSTKMPIEVKGTKQNIKEAFFYLTRNEWETGLQKKIYMFYLWVLNEPLILLRVPFSEIVEHTPEDKKSGEWQSVKIPFRPFQKFKEHVKKPESYSINA